jgi:hypothetical protein
MNSSYQGCGLGGGGHTNNQGQNGETTKTSLNKTSVNVNLVRIALHHGLVLK